MQSMTDLEASLLADIPKLNADSQAFMRWILDRVIGVGMRDYGPWQAANDGRDMDREIADELADAVVYTGMRAVKRSLNKQSLVEQFKSAQHDHWESLVQDDVCSDCGKNAFDFSDEEPTGQVRPAALSNTSSLASPISELLGEPKTTDYCAVCGQSPDSGTHWMAKWSGGHDYVDPRQLPLPVNAAPSEPACVAPAHVEHSPAEGAAPFLGAGQCDDCAAQSGEVHLEGCSWITVVPAANDEVAL